MTTMRQRRRNAAAAGDEHQSDSNQEVEKRAAAGPGWIGFIIAVVLAGLILRLVTPRPRLFTAEELSKFNGEDEKLPIMLSILGTVFDVTNGREHYGVGGGYHHFAGRDATRAFVSGNFSGDGLTDSIRGLSPIEVKSIGDWRSFYLKTYSYAGKLIGTYYNEQGKPTEELNRAEKRMKRGAELLKQQEAEEKRFPTCNSRWSQSDGGEVWCESGFPRIISKPPQLPSQKPGESRCACFEQKHLNKPGLRIYEGCSATSTLCKTS